MLSDADQTPFTLSVRLNVTVVKRHNDRVSTVFPAVAMRDNVQVSTVSPAVTMRDNDKVSTVFSSVSMGHNDQVSTVSPAVTVRDNVKVSTIFSSVSMGHNDQVSTVSPAVTVQAPDESSGEYYNDTVNTNHFITGRLKLFSGAIKTALCFFLEYEILKTTSQPKNLFRGLFFVFFFLLFL